MKRISALAACILTILFFALPLAAQEEKPFTASELDNFIRDWPKLKKWAEAKNTEAEAGSAAELAFILRGADLDRFVGSMGWKTERFFAVAGRAAIGLMVAETRTQMPGVIQEMQDQRNEIRDSPDIPAAQKQELLKQMDDAIAQMQGLDMMSETEITAAEVRLVEDRRERLKTSLEWAE